MTALRHAIKVSVPRSDAFKALADVKEVAAWHLGIVEGDVGPGATMYLAAKPGLRFGWRTDRIVPEEAIEQTCVEGPGSSPGKVLTFALSDLDRGCTLITLTHGDWREDDPHLPFCNTHWGETLHRLKEYVERTHARAS